MSILHLKFAAKNVFWGYLGALLTMFFSLASRTVFIRTIGIEYLGINGLCQSIIGILSLSELGIGSALLHSLFKPVAENDYEKIKALMRLYRKAYQIIALIVFVLGIILLPFLRDITPGAENIALLHVYYCIFLFNSVTSYFISYKQCLVSADQKNYLLTNINTCANLLLTSAQVFCLFFFKSYILYLLIITVFQTAQKIYTWIYIDKKYPFLKEKSVIALPKADKDQLKINIKAVIWHKMANVCMLQSSNIIISYFINIAAVGLYSNYILFTTYLNKYIDIFFSNLTGSIGNLFALSDNNKCYNIFKLSDFVAFWLYSFSSAVFLAVIQPFICLIWGKECLLPTSFLIIFVFNYYVFGLRDSVHRIALISGIFDQDKHLAILQTVFNLVLSLTLVRFLGLSGILLGTVLAGLIAALGKPYILFKHAFKRSPWIYYRGYVCRLGITIFTAVICWYMTKIITGNLNWTTFLAAVIASSIVSNLILAVIYFRSENFILLNKLVSDFIKNGKNKFS